MKKIYKPRLTIEQIRCTYSFSLRIQLAAHIQLTARREFMI